MKQTNKQNNTIQNNEIYDFKSTKHRNDGFQF